MAVVKRSPDADRGVTCSDLAAMAAVDRAVHEGADIVDIGGAGPGPDVEPGAETRRAVSFVAAVRERHPELLISVDTWRHEVARPTVEAGADILNNTRPGVDPKLAEIAAEHGCGLVCSRTGGASPRSRPYRVPDTDEVRDIVDDLTAQAAKLVGLGVPKEAILIDPTHDLDMNTRHGLELLRRCDELVATGWPVLIGLPGKDVIGKTLDAGVDDQVGGTLAATVIAAWARVRVFRAHQVRQTRRVLEMVASIAGTRPPAHAIRGLATEGPGMRGQA